MEMTRLGGVVEGLTELMRGAGGTHPEPGLHVLVQPSEAPQILPEQLGWHEFPATATVTNSFVAFEPLDTSVHAIVNGSLQPLDRPGSVTNCCVVPSPFCAALEVPLMVQLALMLVFQPTLIVVVPLGAGMLVAFEGRSAKVGSSMAMGVPAPPRQLSVTVCPLASALAPTVHCTCGLALQVKTAVNCLAQPGAGSPIFDASMR